MYSSAKDFITIDGLDFGGVLDGDNAFSYSRTGDSVITRVDSSGRIIPFEATDQSGRATINITPGPEGVTCLKKLRQLMNTKKQFTMVRDNRNEGGEKATFLKCMVANDGENGKNASGEKNARSFEIIYERKLEEEGVN